MRLLAREVLGRLPQPAVLLVLGALALGVLALGGCGGDSDDDSGAAATEAAPSAEGPPRRGFSEDELAARRQQIESKFEDCKREATQRFGPAYRHQPEVLAAFHRSCLGVREKELNSLKAGGE